MKGPEVRGRILFIAAVLAFVAIVPLVYWALFERGLSVSTPSSPPPVAPVGLSAEIVEQVPEAAPVALSVTALQGKVEITRGGKGGWAVAEEGMVLAAKDRIRTLADAQATLSMPGVFSVRLRPESEFRVRHLAEKAFRFLLEEGMIAADVIEDPDHLFEVAASTAVATTRGGSFKMNVNQDGLVAVGTSRGTVDLEAEGRVVQLKRGYMSRVERGKVPEDPIRIPNRLFLKVRWPSRRDRSSRQLAVKGKTEAGARVKVAGVTVEVDAAGEFHTVVALKEGANRVEVVAEDVGGNKRRRRSPRYQVDTRSDAFRIDTSPEMWEKRGGPDGG